MRTRTFRPSRHFWSQADRLPRQPSQHCAAIFSRSRSDHQSSRAPSRRQGPATGLLTIRCCHRPRRSRQSLIVLYSFPHPFLIAALVHFADGLLPLVDNLPGAFDLRERAISQLNGPNPAFLFSATIGRTLRVDDIECWTRNAHVIGAPRFLLTPALERQRLELGHLVIAHLYVPFGF